MEYYYTDETNTPQGPVSAESLKNLFFQNRLALESPIFCVGQDEWKTLSIHIPELAILRNCPKCAQKVDKKSSVCPNCRFPIADYETNCAKAKLSPLVSIAYTENDITALVKTYRKENRNGALGCGLLGLPVAGILAIVCLFIPIIGPVLAIVLVICAVAAPLAGIAEFYGIIKGNEEHKTRWRKAAIADLARKVSGYCPKCLASFERIDIRQNFECPSCRTKSVRVKGQLLWVPKPRSYDTYRDIHNTGIFANTPVVASTAPTDSFQDWMAKAEQGDAEAQTGRARFFL